MASTARPRYKKWSELRPTQQRAKSAKGKGKAFERLIAERLELISGGRMKARTMGEAGSDVEDLDHVLPWHYTETKHYKSYPSLNYLTSLLNEKKGQQVFFIKANHRPSLVVMELEIFEQILQNYFYSRSALSQNIEVQAKLQPREQFEIHNGNQPVVVVEEPQYAACVLHYTPNKSCSECFPSKENADESHSRRSMVR